MHHCAPLFPPSAFLFWKMLVKCTLHSLYAGSWKCASYLTVFMVAAESALVTLCSLYGGSGKCASYFTQSLWWQQKVRWLLYGNYFRLVILHSFHAGKQVWWPFACVSGLMRHSHPSLWQQRRPTKHWRRKLTDNGVILLRWVVAVYVCVCVFIYECMQSVWFCLPASVCACVYVKHKVQDTRQLY